MPLDDPIHLPPVEPTKVVCVHLNYESRRAEFQATLGPAPTYFHKPISSLNAHGGEIVRPPRCRYLNYEGEIGIVIGERCRHVAPDEADAYIQGYTIGNDYGLHDFRDTDAGSMLRVKGSDTLCPLGPGLVTDWDFHGKRIETRVNGDVAQSGNTDEMIWDMHYLVADIARTITLEPGDVILSGTPANSRPVQPGDVVEVEVEGPRRAPQHRGRGVGAGARRRRRAAERERGSGLDRARRRLGAPGRARSAEGVTCAMATMRYLVHDVGAAISFYVDRLGLRARRAVRAGDRDRAPRRPRALARRPDVVGGPADARRPHARARRLEPSWSSRSTISTPGSTSSARAGVMFRNEIVEGPGGRQILVEDPSGNVVELFEPRSAERTMPRDRSTRAFEAWQSLSRGVPAPRRRGLARGSRTTRPREARAGLAGRARCSRRPWTSPS